MTANYSLTKPEIGASADTWGGKTNNNWDTVDSTIKSVSDAAAAAQATANAALPKAGGTMTGAIAGVTGIKKTGGTISGLASNTPSTILTASSVGGAVTADLWLVSAAASGPGSAYAIVMDNNDSWAIMSQNSVGTTITFSVSGPSLQVQHNYGGGSSNVAWNALPIK